MTLKGKAGLCVALAVAVPIALAACTPGTSDSKDKGKTTTSSAAAVNTDVASMGKITLTVDDFYNTPGLEMDWINAIVKGFEKKYPNVTIKRTAQSFDDHFKTLNLKLSGADAPDIAVTNNGWQSIGTLSKAGLLVDLTPYATAYGWDTSIPDSIQRELKFTADGKQMGTGVLWAVPPARVQLLDVYYNKAKFDKLGGKAPTTFAEFETLLQKAKDAGEVPLNVGTQDKTTSLWFALMDAYGDKQKISDFVYSQNNVPASETGLTEAAATMKKWADAGYLTPNYQGLKSSDAQAKFLAGEGVFRVDYTDALPFKQVSDQNGYGMFQLPRVDGGNLVSTGGPASNYSISSKCKHPDAAAAFLDFIASQEAANITADYGFMPLMHTVTPPADATELFKQSLAVQSELDKVDGYVPYFDWATPTLLDTAGTQVQLILAGKSSPEAATAAVQKDYDAFQAKQGK